MKPDPKVEELLKKREAGALDAEERIWLLHRIGTLTIPQLRRILTGGESDHLREAARDEMMAHAASEPHWTLVPMFWLVVVATAISGVALVVAGLAYQRAKLHQPQSPTRALSPPVKVPTKEMLPTPSPSPSFHAATPKPPE